MKLVLVHFRVYCNFFSELLILFLLSLSRFTFFSKTEEFLFSMIGRKILKTFFKDLNRNKISEVIVEYCTKINLMVL